MREKKLEVLAPAGSFESLWAAVNAGADAVYMGGSRFGARAYAQNPEGENLLAAIDYAHLHGVRLYLTVNTLLKTRELEQELYDYLLPCYEHGLDAGAGAGYGSAEGSQRVVSGSSGACQYTDDAEWSRRSESAERTGRRACSPFPRTVTE